MKRNESERKKSPPREIELPHHTYQPTRAELRKDHHVDATFEEVVSACLKPVKIQYVMPRKRNQQGS